MTNRETVERNIGLTFDFVNYLIDNPSVTTKFPDNFKLEFIEKDFPKIERENKNSGLAEPVNKYVRVRNTFELTK
jgi:hypothetical protein